MFSLVVLGGFVSKGPFLPGTGLMLMKERSLLVSPVSGTVAGLSRSPFTPPLLLWTWRGCSWSSML